MPKRVVVWDLDETLVLFHSLINQDYARANPCCPGVEAHALGEKWQDAILDLADDQFFYREVRNPPRPYPFGDLKWGTMNLLPTALPPHPSSPSLPISTGR